MEGMAIVTQQLTNATSTNKPTVILGDSNLCMNKWTDANYPHKHLVKKN